MNLGGLHIQILGFGIGLALGYYALKHFRVHRSVA